MSLDQYILQNYGKYPNENFAKMVNSIYGTSYNENSIRHKYRRLKNKIVGGGTELTPDTIERDRHMAALKASHNNTSSKYKQALELISHLEQTVDGIKRIQEISSFKIKPSKSSGKSHSTAVVLASDWHVEEKVDKAAVNGLNEYSLKTAEARATEFFQGVLRIIQILQKDTQIDTLILALLGDFISGSIHEDIAENTELGPVDAAIFAETLIISGIQFLLDNSKLDLVIPCHSGNHGRATKEQRYATENANSFEYFMYHNIGNHFRNEKRITFIISPSYFSFVEVYGMTLRFHHGHGFKYGGGIGGMFVPVKRGIAQSSDGKPKHMIPDLDCFGHFHKAVDGGTFVCNGSLIGFNAYANAKKLGFEKPKQMLFLIEENRGRTATWPISFKV